MTQWMGIVPKTASVGASGARHVRSSMHGISNCTNEINEHSTNANMLEYMLACSRPSLEDIGAKLTEEIDIRDKTRLLGQINADRGERSVLRLQSMPTCMHLNRLVSSNHESREPDPPPDRPSWTRMLDSQSGAISGR